MIGAIAAVLSTVSFIPQVLQVVRTKNTEGISLGMYGIFVLGLFLWMLYGIELRDLAMIVANGITFCLASVILGFKIRYGVLHKKRKW